MNVCDPEIINYEDLGFGSPEINFLLAPFTNSPSGSYGNLGFGSSEGVGYVDEPDTYYSFYNESDLLFGSKEIKINVSSSVDLTTYRYVQTQIKDLINIVPGDNTVTFPVDRFDRSPIVSCQAYGLNNNVYVKDVSRTRFIIVNPTDQNLQAAYFVNGVKLEAIV